MGSEHEAHDTATRAAGYKAIYTFCQKDSVWTMVQIIQKTKKHNSRFIGLLKDLTTRRVLHILSIRLLMDFFFLE